MCAMKRTGLLTAKSTLYTRSLVSFPFLSPSKDAVEDRRLSVAYLIRTFTLYMYCSASFQAKINAEWVFLLLSRAETPPLGVVCVWLLESTGCADYFVVTQ